MWLRYSILWTLTGPCCLWGRVDLSMAEPISVWVVSSLTYHPSSLTHALQILKTLASVGMSSWEWKRPRHAAWAHLSTAPGRCVWYPAPAGALQILSNPLPSTYLLTCLSVHPSIVFKENNLETVWQRTAAMGMHSRICAYGSCSLRGPLFPPLAVFWLFFFALFNVTQTFTTHGVL